MIDRDSSWRGIELKFRDFQSFTAKPAAAAAPPTTLEMLIHHPWLAVASWSCRLLSFDILLVFFGLPARSRDIVDRLRSSSYLSAQRLPIAAVNDLFSAALLFDEWLKEQWMGMGSIDRKSPTWALKPPTRSWLTFPFRRWKSVAGWPRKTTRICLIRGRSVHPTTTTTTVRFWRLRGIQFIYLKNKFRPQAPLAEVTTQAQQVWCTGWSQLLAGGVPCMWIHGVVQFYANIYIKGSHGRKLARAGLTMSLVERMNKNNKNYKHKKILTFVNNKKFQKIAILKIKSIDLSIKFQQELELFGMAKLFKNRFNWVNKKMSYSIIQQ